MADSLNFEIVNLSNQNHQQAFFMLMNAYMMDPMGDYGPLSQEHFNKLLSGLQQQNNYLGVLVIDGKEYIGLANCFYAYSTFKAAKLLNIHDFVVLKDKRGKGLGRYLMQSVKDVAVKNDCCKITLEVRTDNPIAQNLYLSEGFESTDPEYLFWQCNL